MTATLLQQCGSPELGIWYLRYLTETCHTPRTNAIVEGLDFELRWYFDMQCYYGHLCMKFQNIRIPTNKALLEKHANIQVMLRNADESLNALCDPEDTLTEVEKLISELEGDE